MMLLFCLKLGFYKFKLSLTSLLYKELQNIKQKFINLVQTFRLQTNK